MKEAISVAVLTAQRTMAKEDRQNAMLLVLYLVGTTTVINMTQVLKMSEKDFSRFLVNENVKVNENQIKLSKEGIENASLLVQKINKEVSELKNIFGFFI